MYKWINQTVYPNNRLYIGGNFSGDFQGSFDAFVMKFGQPSLTPSFTASPLCGNGTVSDPNMTVTLTETTTGSGNILNRIWNFGDGSPVIDTG